MGCGPSYVTQEGKYMAGNHVQFKTGSLLKEAKAAGAIGYLGESWGVTKNQVYEGDQFDDKDNAGLAKYIEKSDFEDLRNICKEQYAVASLPDLAEWKKTIDDKWNVAMVHKNVHAHCCLYNDFGCIAIVLYPKDVFDALPKDKAEAKARAEAKKAK